MRAFLTVMGAVIALVSLPVVIELGMFLFANLFMRSRLRKDETGPSMGRAPLRLAILIPAHNEEKGISRCVESALAADRGGFEREVVVIADNCDDATAAIAGSSGARVIERFDDSLRGKGAAIHYAITKLSPEPFSAFIVIDADTVVSRDFTKVLGERFASGAEAVQCVNLPLNTEASPRIRLANLALLSMNLLRPMGRELLGFSVGILGNGFGLSRKLLEEVPYTANSITEDLEYHLRLVEGGHRVRFVDAARVLSDFPVSNEGSETQRARWEGGRFMLQRKLFFPMAGKILSGKGRLIEPLLELMSLPLSYEVLMLLALVVLPAQPFCAYGAFGLTLVLAQLVAAVALYGTKRDFLAFLEIPSYIIWKIRRLPSIVRASRGDSSWIRTKRD